MKTKIYSKTQTNHQKLSHENISTHVKIFENIWKETKDYSFQEIFHQYSPRNEKFNYIQPKFINIFSKFIQIT